MRLGSPHLGSLSSSWSRRVNSADGPRSPGGLEPVTKVKKTEFKTNLPQESGACYVPVNAPEIKEYLDASILRY